MKCFLHLFIFLLGITLASSGLTQDSRQHNHVSFNNYPTTVKYRPKAGKISAKAGKIGPIVVNIGLKTGNIGPKVANVRPRAAKGKDMQAIQNMILSEISWSARRMLLKTFETTTQNTNNMEEDGMRKVDIQALVLPPARRDDKAEEEEAEKDDTNMKMKLFRLMYETVRDSDLKVKRAELIKKHYTNSSAFEEGYLLGDVTDKFNIMTDISSTLQRLYHEWKPIEHINAYEQIANLAIDVGHVVDMVRGVEKRSKSKNSGDDDEGGGGKMFASKTTRDPNYFDIPG